MTLDSAAAGGGANLTRGGIRVDHRCIMKVFLAVFAAVSCGVIGHSLHLGWKSMMVADWPVAMGRIISSEIGTQSDSEGGSSHSVKVSYEYSVMGEKHEGERLAYGYQGSGRKKAEQLLEMLPAGRQLEVRYDPEDPRQSALAHGIHHSILGHFLTGCTLLAMSSAMLFISCQTKRTDEAMLDTIRVH